MITQTPPVKRNGKIRTYFHVLKRKLANGPVRDKQQVKWLYRVFGQMKMRIDTSPRDSLAEFNVDELSNLVKLAVGFPFS